MRYFTDIYWLYNAGKNWSFTSCFYAEDKTRKQIKMCAARIIGGKQISLRRG
jgi:hypothetical protein